MREPFLFIVGCARSGTTLLQRVLNAHPELLIVPEIHWITEEFESKESLNLDSTVSPEMMQRWIVHKRFPELQISADEFLLLFAEGISCRMFLTVLLDFLAQKASKHLVGNKTPPYIKQIPSLHAGWPTAKFVHLIRDGRDVCLSVLNWKKAGRTAGKFATWNSDPITTTALWWKRSVQIGRESGANLGPALYYEARYEGLVEHPENFCRNLCGFLETSYDARLLRFYEFKTENELHKKAKSWRPITPGLRNWHSEMKPEDIERFEAAAGDLLTELGYPRMFPNPSSEIRRNSREIFQSLTEEVRSKGGQLPQQWN
jgi:Sulfotransferase family